MLGWSPLVVQSSMEPKLNFKQIVFDGFGMATLFLSVHVAIEFIFYGFDNNKKITNFVM